MGSNAGFHPIMRCHRRWWPTTVFLGTVLMLSPAPARALNSVYDPLEPVNRFIFGFNQVVDTVILNPAQQVYGVVVPAPAKTGLRNFTSNLRSPVTFVNDILQGERERAGVTLGRFMINTTLGLFGLFDFASVVGMEEAHTEDLGQTMGVYGVGPGPYLIVPILGPSSARDLTGTVVTALTLDPASYVMSNEAALGLYVADGIDTRYQLDPAIRDLKRNSLDLYASTRTVYLQKREADIRNGGSLSNDQNYEDIFSEEFEDSLDEP